MIATLESLVGRVRQQTANAAEAALRQASSQTRSGEQDLAQIERAVLLDRALGVDRTSWTPGVQEVVAWADAELAYGRASEFLERTMGLSLSKDAHEALSATLGEAVQPEETDRAAQA